MSRRAQTFYQVIAVVSCAAIVTQLLLIIFRPSAGADPVEVRLGRFFSYFTIWTNILVAVACSFAGFARNSRLGRLFSGGSAVTALASYVLIVTVIYTFLLKTPTDLASIAGWIDIVFHYLIPLMVIGAWVFAASKSGLRWTDAAKWLVFPTLFVVYTIVRGAIIGWYPYWFANVGVLGYPVALRNTGFVLTAFFVVGMLFVAAARLIDRRTA